MRGAAVVLFALVGCRGPCDAVVDCGGLEVTHAYVVSVLEVPEIAGVPAGAFGHDLDGHVSDGSGPACTDAADFVSPLSGAGGVDNQLAVFAPVFADDFPAGDLNRELAARIASGELLLVLWVTSNGLVADANVMVHAHLVAPHGELVLRDGLIVPGQVFDERTDLGTAVGQIVSHTPGSGRLDVVLPVLPLTVVAGDVALVLPLRNVRLTADIDEETLTRGELGGSIDLADLAPLDALLTCPGVCPTEPTIRDVAHPDLAPDSAGECTAVSAGLRFEAVGATPPEG